MSGWFYLMFSAKYAFSILHVVGWSSFNYKLILSLFLILLLLFWTRLFRGKSMIKFMRFSCLVFSVLSLFLFFKVSTVEFVNRGGLEEYRKKDNNFRLLPLEPKEKKIIHVLFDGFTGFSGMEKYWDYSNEPLAKALEEKNFIVFRDARSEFDNTLSSMTSVFNMKPDKPFPKFLNSVTHERVLRKENLNKAFIPTYFKENGYTIENLSFFQIKEEKEFYKYHLLQEKVHFIRFLFDISLPGNIFKTVKTDGTHLVNNDILDILNKKNFSNNSWTYAHLMLPHEPYNFLRDGTLKPNRTDRPKEELYLDQYIYTSTMIQDLADKMIENNPNAIIVFQSDHGSRLFQKDPSKDNEKFHTLLAIRFGNEIIDQNSLDRFNATNTYRFILNKAFGQKLEILPTD